MGVLYHGSATKGIKKLSPHKSSHVYDYVYATTERDLAIIFSARCGDDCTQNLYRNSENGPWILVERIPEGFNTTFNNSSSIYTLDDSTFKDINTGFSELVSEVAVDVKNEEHIDNVYDEIRRMASEGKVLLYTYPNKPKDMPKDNSDLIDKEIRQKQRENQQVTKRDFERIILLHPYLIDKVNQRMKELNLNEEPYKKEDLIILFENAVIGKTIHPEREEYIKSIIISISNTYPELLPKFKEKLLFVKKTKEEKNSILFEKLSDKFTDMSTDEIEQLKNKYLSDERDFVVIARELEDFIKKSNQEEKKEETNQKQK